MEGYMEDKLSEKINFARRQVAEAERYAKLYQEQFKEQADQSIQFMKEEVECEKVRQEKALQEKKDELANLQKEIEAGNIKDLLKRYKGE